MSIRDLIHSASYLNIEMLPFLSLCKHYEIMQYILRMLYEHTSKFTV